MKRTYKYRLHVTKEQERKLESTLNACCFLYNSALQEKREAWKGNRKRVNYVRQVGELVGCKAEFPELDNVYSQVLQDVLRRLDKAFQDFFRRAKGKDKKLSYPRFKSKERYHSFTYPQNGFGIRNGKLHLSKIGDIKIRLHRPIVGEIKTLTLTREIDKWYACFSVEIPTPKLKVIRMAVGIDVGLNSFVSLSTGEQISNPKWFRDNERHLGHHQRSLSKKRNGSQNRNKQRVRVVKLHRKVANQRKDFHHKLARQLVNVYDLIAYEDLNIKGMVGNHHLAKSISDAGWAQFIAFVCYKAEGAGGQAIAMNAYGTSVKCSSCGFPVSKSLAERTHRCPNCDLEIDRDWNAARNILALALPQELREVKPVGIELLPISGQVWSRKQEIADTFSGSSPIGYTNYIKGR